MPKQNKSFSVDNTSEKKRELEEAQRRKRKNRTIITVVSILSVIAIVISLSYYWIYVRPMQRTVIKVNDESVKISYLLNRALMSANPTDIQSAKYQIVNELLIKQGAPKYGITVSDADIDLKIKALAQGTSTTISDAEAKEWYLQQLNQSQLSDKQYRELISISIMGERLQKVLEASIPTVADQVHLHYILIADYQSTLNVKSRIEGGEDFATIARELSIVTDAIDNSGDLGWMPVHALLDKLEFVVAGLDVGKISDPIAMGDGPTSTTDPGDTTDYYAPYALVMVSEKSAAMALSDANLAALKGRALSDWLAEQFKVQKITYHGNGPNGGYDSETEAWLIYQVHKLEKSRGITTTTTATTTAIP